VLRRAVKKARCPRKGHRCRNHQPERSCDRQSCECLLDASLGAGSRREMTELAGTPVPLLINPNMLSEHHVAAFTFSFVIRMPGFALFATYADSYELSNGFL